MLHWCDRRGGISRITLISGKDSGQSDGLHSASLANELFEFTKGNILASNYKNQWEKHQDFTKNNAKEPPFWKHRIGGKYLIFLLAENFFAQHAVQSLLRFFQLFSLVFGVNQSNIAIKHTCNYCVTTAEKNVREARWRSMRENLGNILSLYFRW